MARWKLTEPHYLNVPGTKWEYVATDKFSGKPTRKMFPVPLFLHPDDQNDWNYDKRGDGYIVVAYAGKGLPDDIIFEGPPTPGMLPIDDEAKVITDGFKASWTPTQGTDEVSQMNSFQNKVLNGLIEQMHSAQTQAQSAPIAPGFDKFMDAMLQMMAQQTQILAAITGKSEFLKQGEALGEKQILDEAPPLDDAEPTPEELDLAAALAAEKEQVSQMRAQNAAMTGRR